MSADWTHPLRLHELARGPVTVTLEPDAEQRAKAARDLNLQSLPKLTATVTVKPWLDGAELTGRFKAVVEQVCSVTLDPFEQRLEGEIHVRAVPEGSPNAGADEGGEVELDLEAEDPPDVLNGEIVDVAAYVIEHLALEIDPFPRKPGAEFEYTPPTEEESPFAVLKKLQEPKD
jgi:uncharacterized metal-binding protein YceD (DUF177 family)